MAPPQIRDGMNARIPVKFMLIYSLAFLRIYSKGFSVKINISCISSALLQRPQLCGHQQIGKPGQLISTPIGISPLITRAEKSLTATVSRLYNRAEKQLLTRRRCTPEITLFMRIWRNWQTRRF